LNFRPFDARRDLKQVADLIEVCFADTLDADGKRYLQQMRVAADNPRYLTWATSAIDLANLPMKGFVGVHEGRLVGNLSLIPFQSQGRFNYLIANVAVHPEFRRRGIARQLTQKAIEDVQKRGAPAVWLHVRDENTAAITLYQKLGFKERARRTTWFSQGDYQPPQMPPEIKIRPYPPQSWDLQRAWFLHHYPSELAWHFTLKLSEMRPGWLAAMQRFFKAYTIRQWTAYRNDLVSGVLTYQSARAYADTIWLAPPPAGDDASVLALLIAARNSLPRHRPLTLDFPTGSADQALQAAGFLAHQTLIWMQIHFS
jgi:ribosomal protein S18 acetylase RimI-like enzyme